MNRRQHEYLKAMGIDVWLPKALLPVERAEQEVEQTVAEVMPDISVTTTESQPQVETIVPDAGISALNWDALQTRVDECRLCDLHKIRTQTVFGTGNRHADWLIVGEAPGEDEDRQGIPFVGRAGQLLTAMLTSLDLGREDVYIVNILKCRSPENHVPNIDEVWHCTSYLQRQIQLIQPKVILALGQIAAQNLLQTNTTLGRLRGKLHHIEMSSAPVIVTHHPAYLLRSPLEKGKSWEDLLFAKKTLESIGL